MTREWCRAYAAERGWLTGDDDRDRRIVSRLWWHFNVLAA